MPRRKIFTGGKYAGKTILRVSAKRAFPGNMRVTMADSRNEDGSWQGKESLIVDEHDYRGLIRDVGPDESA
jgi:hypothetical protein